LRKVEQQKNEVSMLTAKLHELKQVMEAQLRYNEVVANNLANTNTTAFKQDLFFYDVLSDARHATLRARTMVDFSQGTLVSTNEPLDFAFAGKGFFVVRRGEEELYSRDGHFHVDAQGYLVNAAGDRVQGEGGDIYLAYEEGQPVDIRLARDGSLFLGDHLVDRLRLVDFESYSGLRKAGGNAFRNTGSVEPKELEQPQVLQGKLETANVKPVREMVSLIEMERRFQTAQRVVKTIDDTLKQASNTIPKY